MHTNDCNRAGRSHRDRNGIFWAVVLFWNRTKQQFIIRAVQLNFKLCSFVVIIPFLPVNKKGIKKNGTSNVMGISTHFVEHGRSLLVSRGMESNIT